MPHASDTTQYFWLALAATLVAMVAQRLRLPYAIALVLTGLAIGAPRLIPQAHLEPHLLFTVFLPPLLFEAAINLRIDSLIARWRTIVLFALGGTLVSAVTVGGLGASLLGLPPLVAVTFGSLISPTDPISVIAVFKRLGVEKKLATVVEAESLFNDGVAVVLFGVLSAAAMGAETSIPVGIRQFAVVVLGGAAVGMGVGWLASRVTRAFDDHLLEIMLTTLVAFGSYLGAEALHVSGVIAVVAAGLIIGNYGMQVGMSPTTRLAVSSFWEFAAFMANSLVFLLIGIEVTVVDLWGRIGLVLTAAAIVLAGRVVAVYGIAPIAGALEASLPLAWRHVLVWGGLRGALSMALVLGLPREFPERELLVALTFGVVALSLLCQGLSIARLLSLLGLGHRDSRMEAYGRLTAERFAILGGLSELARQSETGRLSRDETRQLRQRYEQRLEEAEDGIAAFHANQPRLREQRETSVRRLALLGEKSAVLEAIRNGLIEEGSAGPTIAQIDTSLTELETSSHSAPLEESTAE